MPHFRKPLTPKQRAAIKRNRARVSEFASHLLLLIFLFLVSMAFLVFAVAASGIE